MAVRSTMAALILRVRLLINDTLPIGSGQVFADQDIQDVLDESRLDVFNSEMRADPTFTGATFQFLDYMTTFGGEKALGGWEDGMVLKQYLTTVVTPATIEPIVGHFTFAANTYPPVFISGKIYDVYRAAADLLERWAAKWTLLYTVTVDGQHLRPGMVADAQQKLAKTYRMKQRAGSITTRRSDIAAEEAEQGNLLGPRPIDFYASG